MQFDAYVYSLYFVFNVLHCLIKKIMKKILNSMKWIVYRCSRWNRM